MKRLTDRLEEIRGLLNRWRYAQQAYVQTQIERAPQGYPAKRLVDTELTGGDDNLTLTYRVNEEKLVEAEALDGRYLLGTNQNDLSADEILHHFRQ